MANKTKFGPTRHALCSCIVLLLIGAGLCLNAVSSQAQTFTKLLDFPISSLGEPLLAELVQGSDGNFWGTTSGFNGSIFKMTPRGGLTTVYTDSTGQTRFPWGRLTLAPDGNFYGVSPLSGPSGLGSIFRISPGGTYTDIHDFSGPDGAYPHGDMVVGWDNQIYGTTDGGGNPSCGGAGCGTVFKISLNGSFATVYSFDNTHGSAPLDNPILGRDGNFYGTTSAGGAHLSGAIYRLTPAGKITVLHSFGGPDGSTPWAKLVQGSDGKLYGSTPVAGAYGWGTIFSITPRGAFATIYNFTGGSDGSQVLAPIVQGTDGNLYGTNWANGDSPGCSPLCGVLFQITHQGKLTVLHSFSESDGGGMNNSVVQGTDGKFYGTTSACGSAGCGVGFGTAYTFDMGFGPLVTLPVSHGRVGFAVQILGSSLKGTTHVTFHGTSASFKVHSQFSMTATVPAGATSGPVVVSTPTGTLTSNSSFEVVP